MVKDESFSVNRLHWHWQLNQDNQ